MTGDILYICPVSAGHWAIVPVIEPGVAGVPGCTVTASVFGELVPHVLPAVTDMSPFCPDDPVVTVTDVVPWPVVTDHPVGTVQL